jgi:hypothetical protein
MKLVSRNEYMGNRKKLYYSRAKSGVLNMKVG